MNDLFDWMEEPCTCGDVYSHPDGGDSQCRYCDGAIRMREKFKQLRIALRFYADEDSYPDKRLHRLTAVARSALDQL